MASSNYGLPAKGTNDEEDIVRGDIVGSGRWEILDDGTRGGMATVFRARDTRTQGEVALKVIARRYIGRFDREKRFENEGRLAARLKGHRNIATPIETGVLADRANRMYLAMELVRGPTLLDYISMNGPLPIGKACTAIRDIARALRDLHASDVVHRDVTTNNVILVETDLHSHTHSAKLIDFGLAADIGGEGQTGERLTRVGELPGTPHYMSPEQVWGEAAHPAFDVYALGIVFFEMLVGEPPWHEMNDIEVKARKCELALPLPNASEHRRDVPESISALITECLQPRFDDRLPSSGAFVIRLDAIRAELGFVDPRAGETTGIVGLPRTVDPHKREPKLKQILADAKAAKEARARAEVQGAETRPVAQAPSVGGADDAAPVKRRAASSDAPTAAMRQGRSQREPTGQAGAAESGQASPRITGTTMPVLDAVVPRGVNQTERAGSAKPTRKRWMALLGVAAGVLLAVPAIYLLAPDPATRAQAGDKPAQAAVLATTAAAPSDTAAAPTAPTADDSHPVLAPATTDDTGTRAEDDATATTGGGQDTASESDDTDTDTDTDTDDDTHGGGSGSAETSTGSSSTGRHKSHKATPKPDRPSAPATVPTPPTKVDDPWTESRCKAEREQAMKDRMGGRFASVLTHTRVKRCWPNERERLELRVRAFSELGRADDCVKTGQHSADAGIARMVRRCRKKLDAAG